MSARNVITVCTASEIARRAKLVDVTVRRAIAKQAIQPDGLLITGKRTSPIYTLAKGRCILRALNSNPDLLLHEH